jgi:hypothetical protein
VHAAAGGAGAASAHATSPILRSVGVELAGDQAEDTAILDAMSLRLFIFCILSLLATTAHAWGTQGHQVIANLAQAQLTAKAKTEIDKLLALEPGETLSSISTWADERRSPTTAAWHYVNFPKNTCTHDAARDCPDGNCIVAAIDRQLEVLKSDAPADRRLLALKYVVHFIADVHQPLHAGYAEDRGGNTYQLQAFMRGTNLHALWDVGLIKNLDLSNEALTARLVAKPVSVGTFNAASIAEESCRIVGMPGFYPDRKVDVPYIERFTPVMEDRLRLAGARLAAVLNGVYP